MADVHLFQWVVAFGGALWLTQRWLLTPPAQRWRHIMAGIVSTVLWIPVAYAATNVEVVTDSGTVVAFGSDALATFSLLMVVVNIAGLLLGLVLWVEQAADETERSLPAEMRHRMGGD